METLCEQVVRDLHILAEKVIPKFRKAAISSISRAVRRSPASSTCTPTSIERDSRICSPGWRGSGRLGPKGIERLDPFYGLEAAGLRSGMLLNGALSALAHTSHQPVRDELFAAMREGGMRAFLDKRDTPFRPRSMHHDTVPGPNLEPTCTAPSASPDWRYTPRFPAVSAYPLARLTKYRET
jgi:hypothetical protein